MQPRLKWHLAKYIPFSSPAHIDVELSTKCKLNCEFCFRKEYKYPAKDISANEYFDILLQASQLEVPSIKFNWRGEALENKDCLYCFEITKSFGIYTMLNTALAGEYSEDFLKILSKTIDNLKVSFDSSSEKIYNEIRKGADFFKTLSNLDKLIDYRKQYKMPKVILNRRTTNISEPDEAFKEFFGDEVDYDIRPAIQRNTESYYFENVFNIGELPRLRKYCQQPSRRMVIDVDGNVWVCCCSYNQDFKLLLGNVKLNTLKELWDKDKRKFLIKDLKKNKFTNDTCKNCKSSEAYI